MFNNIIINLYNVYNTKFHTAVELNQISEVKSMLQTNSLDINYQGEYGNTAFHIACENGYVEIVEHLLSFTNLNQEVRNEDGMTGVHLAAVHERLEVLKVFLKFQIQWNVKDSIGRTPLHFIIGSSDMIKIVCEENQTNLDWNIQDDNGKSPIMHYDILKDRNILSTVTEHVKNINWNLEDNNNYTIAMTVARNASLWPSMSSISHLLDWDHQNIHGESPLSIAENFDNFMVKTFLFCL